MMQAHQYDVLKGYAIETHEVGVVHIGVGAFHRAHQAVYFDALLASGADSNWAIAGVNLRANESAVIDQLNGQHGQYYLKTISATGDVDWHLLKPHRYFVDWVSQPDRAEQLLAMPSVELVTMTVTESGYFTDDQGVLDVGYPLIANEINQKANLGSIYGYLRMGLMARMAALGDAPITLLCCDNLRHNGQMLKSCLLHYLNQMGDMALLEWIDKNVSFPSAMVDRITPRAIPQLDDEMAAYCKKFDASPLNAGTSIVSEDFIQWVIEDNFIGRRPLLEKIGVEFTDDITPYEDMKIRILNGGHTGLVYLGMLNHYEFFDQIMRDSDLAAFFDGFEQAEVAPALAYDLGDNMPISAMKYIEIIKSRFGNQHIADHCLRIAMDGASKMGLFILPTARAMLLMGKMPIHCATIIAAWAVFLDRYLQNKYDFTYIDPKWDQFKQEFIGIDGGLKLDQLLQSADIFQEIPTLHPEFMAQVKIKFNALSQQS
ncbi:MAG: mannitol dehydrogenase family protein [Alphaproteobacteria bacterium]